MSTTTIHLPEDLKARIAAAKRAGTSTHGFILEDIAEKAEQAERHADFDAVSVIAVSLLPGRRFRGRRCAVIWKSVSLARRQSARPPASWHAEYVAH